MSPFTWRGALGNGLRTTNHSSTHSRCPFLLNNRFSGSRSLSPLPLFRSHSVGGPVYRRLLRPRHHHGSVHGPLPHLRHRILHHQRDGRRFHRLRPRLPLLRHERGLHLQPDDPHFHPLSLPSPLLPAAYWLPSPLPFAPCRRNPRRVDCGSDLLHGMHSRQWHRMRRRWHIELHHSQVGEDGGVWGLYEFTKLTPRVI